LSSSFEGQRKKKKSQGVSGRVGIFERRTGGKVTKSEDEDAIIHQKKNGQSTNRHAVSRQNIAKGRKVEMGWRLNQCMGG